MRGVFPNGNKGIFKKGHIGFKTMLGKKHTEEAKEKNRLAHTGKKAKNETRQKMSKSALGKNVWSKGRPNLKLHKEKPAYASIHDWVRRWKGKPTKCENCGKEKTTPKSIQWANIDHTYRRVLDDYIAMCASCHKLYDIYKKSKI